MSKDDLIKQLAIEQLRIAPKTVQKWRERGRVPHRLRLKLSDLAATRTTLRERDFDRFGSNDEPASA